MEEDKDQQQLTQQEVRHLFESWEFFHRDTKEISTFLCFSSAGKIVKEKRKRRKIISLTFSSSP